MKKLKPNSNRAKYAILLIWIVMSLDIISLASNYLEYSLIHKIKNGFLIFQDEADNNDLRQQIIAIIYFIVYITSAITFIHWFRRAYYNINLFRKDFRFSDDWAAGAWFVPFINLYRPFQIMKSMFEKTEQFLWKYDAKYRANLNTTILTFWWMFWLINNFAGQISFRYSKSEILEDLEIASIISMINDFVGIPLAIVTVTLIKKYRTAENFLVEINNIPQEVEAIKIDK